MSPDSPWTLAAESSSLGDRAITLVDGTTFLVCRRTGDISPPGVDGLFLFDTRVISMWRLEVNGREVESLSCSTDDPFSATFVGRVRDPSTESSISVVQRRYIGRGMREDIEIRNHAPDPIRLRIELAIASDLAGLFDVKAGLATGVGARFEPIGEGDRLVARAIDRTSHTVEATTVTCAAGPTQMSPAGLIWDVLIEPGGQWTNCLTVGVVVDGRELSHDAGCDEPIGHATTFTRLRRWRDDVTTIECDWPILAGAVERAREDLGALRIFDPDHPDRTVIAAGAPWYMTLFGRDSLLAGWMALPLDHAIVRGVLQSLADAQGRDVDPITEEQPGRILHEVRFDARSSQLLGGSNAYFGTIDATPLFVMLVAELARWTGVTATITDLMPAVDRALDWVTEFGDRDGDQFVEYQRSGPNGLTNQGWKDSWNGVRHADGSLPRGPIALCEVQGYVYAAYRGRAEIARAMGEHPTVAESFDARADSLRDRFDAAFWIDDEHWYAIGLDGDKHHIGTLTSNIGHLLWTGIVPEHRAEHLAAHLVSPAMFSGWGLRTLSADTAGYDPLSYHCGSVWPHDTALAVAGLARYGYDTEVQLLAEGLLAASARTDGRLPELFAGFGRDDIASPVPYPTSCSPQAWSAASPLLLVRAMLGLEPDLLTGRLRVRPRLGPHLGELRLGRLPLGDARIDISVTADGTHVSGIDDTITIDVA